MNYPSPAEFLADQQKNLAEARVEVLRLVAIAYGDLKRHQETLAKINEAMAQMDAAIEVMVAAGPADPPVKIPAGIV